MDPRQRVARKVSIKDIARKANVDPSTVSRALKNSAWIGRATRDRIAALAREMGYVPNAAARSLVSRRSGAIGICVPGLADSVVDEQVRGVDDVASERGYRLLLAVFYAKEKRLLECLTYFQEQRMDGIIVVAANSDRLNPGSGTVLFTPTMTIGEPNFYAGAEHNYDLGRQALEKLLRSIQGEQPV